MITIAITATICNHLQNNQRPFKSLESALSHHYYFEREELIIYPAIVFYNTVLQFFSKIRDYSTAIKYYHTAINLLQNSISHTSPKPTTTSANYSSSPTNTTAPR